eukprot:TRINITY_DN66257_c10_g3_i1.p1 TRINITY_DN66257_c10_g3~~TRINITY_DN66257_c10_g3_i1.p1  ORF type:complete len:263 (+),score=37.39 TRINITY_DN66257_c10_g3_i1:3-791(+)
MTDEILYESISVGDITIKLAKKNLEHDDAGADPYFFDEDYSPAAATGFTVWEGSRLMVDKLQTMDCVAGSHAVELGSGTGVAGLCAAALGAHVVLTDLAPVVQGALSVNVKLNVRDNTDATSNSPWVGACSVAGTSAGSAVAGVLNWCKPAPEQQLAALAHKPQATHIDMVLAAECVWLLELVQPFVQTVVSILTNFTDKRGDAPVCLMSFKERAVTESTFATKQHLDTAFAEYGFEMQPIARATSADNRDQVLYNITKRTG